MFFDDPTNPSIDRSERRRILAEKIKPKYWFYPAGHKYIKDDLGQDIKEVESVGSLGGINGFFGDGSKLLDIACGGGESAIGFAKEFPALEIIAVDHAFGHEIPLRRTRLKNLSFEEGDWNSLKYPDRTFDRFLSDEGIGRYGHPTQSAREMTRVAKVGAIFRGTIGKQIFGRMGFHEALCEEDWDVYRQSNVIIAVYRGPDFKAKPI